jgi:hypothetical protein
VELFRISLIANGLAVGKMKHLTLDEAKKKYECRPVFEVMVSNRLRQVWSIDGYEHQLGKMNGDIATWWLDLSDDEFDQSELVPWLDRGAHRICWGIDYQQFNTTKHKWDETDIRKGGKCKILANGREIFSFQCSDMAEAMSLVVGKVSELCSHPFNFINPEEEDGRKIWYYGLPAFVRPGYEPGEIKIEPDFSYLTPEDWWDHLEKRQTPIFPKVIHEEEEEELEREKEHLSEYKDYGAINHGSALYDGMINWFRKS